MVRHSEILVLAIVCLTAAPLSGQTPTARRNLDHGAIEEAGALPANNPWLGAQLSARLTEGGDFSDILLTSANLIWTIPTDLPFELPVMGNISDLKPSGGTDTQIAEKIEKQIKNVLSSNHGLNVGLYPFAKVLDGPKLDITLHGSATYKLNALDPVSPEPDSSRLYLHQGRFSAGVELLVGSHELEGQYPLTISVTPVLTVFSADRWERAFGTRKSSLEQVEVTTILPLPFLTGVGLLAEGVYSADSGPAYRLGLLITEGL